MHFTKAIFLALISTTAAIVYDEKCVTTCETGCAALAYDPYGGDVAYGFCLTQCPNSCGC